MTGSETRVAFRDAVADDALCIAVLGTQVYLDTYATEGIRPAIAREVHEVLSTEAVTAALSAPAARFIVAERDGHLVGFAHLDLDAAHASVPAARPAKLHRLYVQERFTGAGLGSALLARAEERVSTEGATALWLTAWIGNARALAFYPRRGYADVGVDWYAFGRGATREPGLREAPDFAPSRYHRRPDPVPACRAHPDRRAPDRRSTCQRFADASGCSWPPRLSLSQPSRR